MATGLAAISSSASSSFHPLFKSSSLFDSSRTSIEGTSCRVTVRSRRSLNSRSDPGTILTVRSAATKPAKSPDSSASGRRVVLSQDFLFSAAAEVSLLQVLIAACMYTCPIVYYPMTPIYNVCEGAWEEIHSFAHPPGAINVQIYRQACSLCVFRDLHWNGREPGLLKKKDAKIIVACTNGGTIRPSQNLPEGQQSLVAAYLLVLNGYANVNHLEGGLYTWFKEGFPTSTED